MKSLWFEPLLALILICSVIPFVSSDNDPGCFRVEPDACSKVAQSDKRCFQKDSTTYYCCSITNDQDLRSIGSTVTGLHIIYANATRLTADLFGRFSSMTSLSITKSTIGLFQGKFPSPSLSCLNISDNSLNITNKLISELKTLKSLDLSYNNLTIIPDLNPDLNNVKLDVSGNRNVECRSLVNLILEIYKTNRTILFQNENQTKCLPSLQYFNNHQWIALKDLDSLKSIIYDCPKKCECATHSVNYVTPTTKAYSAAVNCSNRGLTSLPDNLPLYTRVLDLNNNAITSFDGIENEKYGYVIELYIDNNKISSFSSLEHTEFLSTFQNLSVRYNKIEQLPLDILGNVFDRKHGQNIMLAGNEFNCVCEVAIDFKRWLLANGDQIPDYQEIYAKCETKTKVIDMDAKGLSCIRTHNWRNYIIYVIYLEIMLLVLLVTKVSYDYYVFKTTGSLPWPASKMPKLPCDWCFERR